VLDPGSSLEVDRVHLDDPPSPDRGRATEEPEATLIERVVGKADRLADPQILDRLLPIRPTTLEYADVEPGGRKSASQGDAGRACPQNADLGFENSPIVGNIECLDHPWLHSSGGRVSRCTCAARDLDDDPGRDRREQLEDQ